MGAVCEQMMDAALAALDARLPEHADIVSATIHEEDRSTGVVRSGSLMIVVFDLADGTRRAAGAYCGPGLDGTACWPSPRFNDTSLD